MLSLDQARQVFLAAQGFPAAASPGRTVAQVLEEAGFMRTLGGVDVYVALRARVPGFHGDDLDAAVESGEAGVVPAVRGCIYLVARRHVPLALRAAEVLSRPRDEREHAKAGIRPGEVEELAAAVLQVLGEKGPLTTDALRRALPAGSVRSLGEAGKKVGISSPLPAALRRLEFAGRVERALESRRLDSERYLWRAAARDPFAGAGVPDEPAELWAALARIFFRAAGLGTVKDFAAWAGIAQRDAKAAAEKAGLVPVAIDGVQETHYLLEERRGLLERAGEAAAAVAFLSFEDNLVHLHGGPALLVDAAHHGLTVPSWGSRRPPILGEAKHLAFRSFVAGGRIAGFWEYDPDARTIVHAGLGELTAAQRGPLQAAAGDLARFLADDLGHGRSFSLDTDGELRMRAGAVRALAAS